MNSHKKSEIVVGVDGSEASVNALKWAYQSASESERPLRVVTTWDGTYVAVALAAFGGVDPDQDSIEARQLKAKEMQVSTLFAAFGNEPLPKWVQCEIVEGKATDALVQVSRDAFLLVLGTRGHGHVADIVLGSVSSACVLQANCPVAVIREDTNI